MINGNVNPKMIVTRSPFWTVGTTMPVLLVQIICWYERNNGARE
jgi:hypothetical protein